MHVHSPHRQVNSRVNTQRSIFGWERPTSILHNDRVSGADVAIDDKLVIKTTFCASVVGFADRQEVRRETSCHHLARIDEDICGKEAKCKDTWDTQKQHNEKSGLKNSTETLTHICLAAYKLSLGRSKPHVFQVYKLPH